MLNGLINSPFRNLEKVLDSLYNLFKIDDVNDKLVNHDEMIVATVQNLSQIIYK